MRMLCTVVNVHVADNAATETVFGEHTFHNLDEQGVVAGFEVLVLSFLHKNLGSGLPLTAGVACVREVNTVCHLLAGENNFVGVDDDYIVAAIHVGRIAGLVLAAENLGDFSAKASKNLVGGVDNDPLAFNVFSADGFSSVA